VSAALSNFTAPDSFSEKTGFLRCQGTVRVRINIANQAIFWRRGFGMVGGNVGNWEPEEELPPFPQSLNDRCDAIQIRAAIPTANLPAGALQAQVSLSTRTAEELSSGA
jgi:hypothetical protein